MSVKIKSRTLEVVEESTLFSKETQYNRFSVVDRILSDENGEKFSERRLMNGKRIMSGIWLDSPTFESSVPYANLILMAWWFNPNIRKIAVLGVGGRVIQTSLSNLFQDIPHELSIDEVDIDSEVFEIAEKFFTNHQANPRLKSHCLDGLTFLDQQQSKFDLIILDAFSFKTNEDTESLYSIRGFEAAKKRLSESGLLLGVINAPIRESTNRSSNPFFLNRLRDIFEIYAEQNVRVFSSGRLQYDQMDWLLKGQFERNDQLIFAGREGLSPRLTLEEFCKLFSHFKPGRLGYSLSDYWQCEIDPLQTRKTQEVFKQLSKLN